MQQLPYFEPNGQPTTPVAVIVTVDRHTRFGFQASTHRLELIIGAVGAGGEGGGSSVRLVVEDAPDIVMALMDLLSSGQQEVERIGESEEVVRWPRPPSAVRATSHALPAAQ